MYYVVCIVIFRNEHGVMFELPLAVCKNHKYHDVRNALAGIFPIKKFSSQKKAWYDIHKHKRKGDLIFVRKYPHSR